MPTHTRINARAVIRKDDTILLCQFIDKDYFFLPGGGVEHTEPTVAALGREMIEELGVKLLSASFMGAMENIFDNNGDPYHELNLVFNATIDTMDPVSQEEKLHFVWMPITKLASEKVYPKPLIVAVVQWLKDGKMFWVPMGK